MLQTVVRPVVTMFALCAYCPASTSFRCLNCGTAMCPDCCPSDYCPDCQPSPIVPLMGFSTVNEGNGVDDAVAIACECAICGDRFYSEDADDDLCAACAMDSAELAALRMIPAHAPARPACAFCGD